VKRLLTFGRSDPGASPERVLVDVLLHDVAQLTAPRWRDAAQAERRPITMHIEAAEGLVVEGWTAALREALTNLVFNAVDALPTAPADAPPEVEAPRATAPARQLRILTVDDEPLICKMMKRTLRAGRHYVVTATSGEEALEILRSDCFDIVISDVGLGSGMNGWELAEHSRRDWPHLAIVLATGWGAQIDPAEARQKGVDAVLAKPYRPEDLMDVLGQLSPANELDC